MTSASALLVRPPRPTPARFMAVTGERRICSSCERGWEHCHDAMVVHTAAQSECTNADCLLAAELHTLAVECVELSPTCSCGA